MSSLHISNDVWSSSARYFNSSQINPSTFPRATNWTFGFWFAYGIIQSLAHNGYIQVYNSATGFFVQLNIQGGSAPDYRYKLTMGSRDGSGDHGSPDSMFLDINNWYWIEFNTYGGFHVNGTYISATSFSGSFTNSSTTLIKMFLCYDRVPNVYIDYFRVADNYEYPPIMLNTGIQISTNNDNDLYVLNHLVWNSTPLFSNDTLFYGSVSPNGSFISFPNITNWNNLKFNATNYNGTDECYAIKLTFDIFVKPWFFYPDVMLIYLQDSNGNSFGVILTICPTYVIVQDFYKTTVTYLQLGANNPLNVTFNSELLFLYNNTLNQCTEQLTLDDPTHYINLYATWQYIQNFSVTQFNPFSSISDNVSLCISESYISISEYQNFYVYEPFSIPNFVFVESEITPTPLSGDRTHDISLYSNTSYILHGYILTDNTIISNGTIYVYTTGLLYQESLVDSAPIHFDTEFFGGYGIKDGYFNLPIGARDNQGFERIVFKWNIFVDVGNSTNPFYEIFYGEDYEITFEWRQTYFPPTEEFVTGYNFILLFFCWGIPILVCFLSLKKSGLVLGGFIDFSIGLYANVIWGLGSFIPWYAEVILGGVLFFWGYKKLSHFGEGRI